MNPIPHLLAALCLLAAISSCDTRSGWEDAPLQTLPAAQQRHILVEEYTGQRCVNCPPAAKLLHEISETLPGAVVIVGMHAPMTGQTLPELASETADVYAHAVELHTSAPHISINRQNFKGARYLTNRAEWPASIFNAVNTPAAYRIDLRATLQNGSVDVNADVRQMDAEPRDLNILLWVVEDVRARQIVEGKMQENYLHRNVFRAALNGPWGEAMALPKDEKKSAFRARYPLPENIVDANNAKIIALLRHNLTGEILETALLPLGKGISEASPSDNPQGEAPSAEAPAGEDAIWFSEKPDGSGRQLRHGRTLDTHNALRIQFTDLDSGILYLQPGKKQGKGAYEMVISCLDDLNDAESGLVQVCIEGNCFNLQPEERKNYRTSFTLGLNEYFDQSLSVHYRLNPKSTNTASTHRVRIAILQNGQEIAHYFLRMNYNPEAVVIVGG